MGTISALLRGAAVACVIVFSGSTAALSQTAMAKAAIEKAEAGVKKLQSACAADLKSFCSTVTPGDGRLGLCLVAHEDKISDKCYGALADSMTSLSLTVSSLQRAADVCDKDIGKLCSKVQAGEGRIAQCLVDNKAKLTAPCRGEVVSIEARLKK